MIRSSRFVHAMKPAVVAALFVVAFSTSARAAAIIDFSTGFALAGGTLTVDAKGNVVGAGIGIDLLEVSGTPMNGGTYDVSGAALGGTAAELSFNTAENWIRIVGGVSALGITDQKTVLLSGSISSFDFNTGLFGLLGGFTATGPDSKSTQLLKALGLPANTPFQYFGFSIGFDSTPFDRNNTYKVVSADIVNTQVPEPSTLMLLGTGLFGLAGAARRRLRGTESLDR